jgi:hypothetical protein
MMTLKAACFRRDRKNMPDGSTRGARAGRWRDAGRGRRGIPRARQALASRSRRRARGRAADGGDQRRLRPPARGQARAAPRPATTRGHWLAPAIRRALGHELLALLEPRENVWLVTPATTWASPQSLLAASDHRLLWLLDDAVTARVHTLPFAAIEAAEHTLRRPRRRVATLRIRALDGRRVAFGELRPATAAALARRIAAA